MGAVMIKCPATGKGIPTGMRADRKSFSRTPVFIAHAYCPFCRTQHEWFAKDAWVEESAVAHSAEWIDAPAEDRAGRQAAGSSEAVALDA